MAPCGAVGGYSFWEQPYSSIFIASQDRIMSYGEVTDVLRMLPVICVVPHGAITPKDHNLIVCLL